MNFSRFKSFKAVIAAGLALAALGAASVAQARDNVYWSVGVQAAPGVTLGVGNHRPYAAPVYVQPAPVYVQPAPVYMPPQQVYYPQNYYVQPAPVYVQPYPVYRAGYHRPHNDWHGNGRGNGHGKHKHHRNHRGRD